MKKARKRRSGNYTSNPTSGDDLLALGSFVDCTPPPRADLHPNIDKQKLQACYSIYKLGLDVRMSKHKPIKAFKYTMIWDRKSNSFINNSMIIPLQSKSATVPRTWSGLLFTKIQVHLCISFSSQPSDLFLGSEWVKWREKG
jgi:hypothetical protein